VILLDVNILLTPNAASSLHTPAREWHDRHLAALAIEHGLTLCSTDGDFARFPGLSWRNALVS
jgi:predicted nucleic acid-binding protein